jgi:hypothetical protein
VAIIRVCQKSFVYCSRISLELYGSLVSDRCVGGWEFIVGNDAQAPIRRVLFLNRSADCQAPKMSIKANNSSSPTRKRFAETLLSSSITIKFLFTFSADLQRENICPSDTVDRCKPLTNHRSRYGRFCCTHHLSQKIFILDARQIAGHGCACRRLRRSHNWIRHAFVINLRRGSKNDSN